MSKCAQLEEATIPCLRHHGGAWAGCELTYCLDCGKDIKRDCEGETEIETCTRCGQEVESDSLVSYGDWKLCELCQGDI